MDGEDRWADFIEFIGRAPAAQHPGVLFDGFRLDLIGRGASEENAAAQMRQVMELSMQRSDWASPMFDRIYTSDAPLFRLEPNDFVVRMAAHRPPGRALDVAMGQGRNGVHLAATGWQVTGFDLSVAGLEAAVTAAEAQGAAIETVLASSEDFDYGASAWDLIVMTYAPVPVTAPVFAATIVRALRPGGLVVVESFAVDEARPRRPVDLDPDALRAAYAELDEVTFELAEEVADWTLQPAGVVRLAAERRHSEVPGPAS